MGVGGFSGVPRSRKKEINVFFSSRSKKKKERNFIKTEDRKCVIAEKHAKTRERLKN